MAKVKDLNDNSPPCMRYTASHSHDQTQVLVDGGRLPVRPFLVPPL